MKTSTIVQFVAVVSFAVVAALPAAAQLDTSWGVREVPYSQVIQQVVNMPGDGDLQQRCQRYGLNVINVMWEDTGRAGGS